MVDVPLRGLLSQGFADERRCLIGERANASPVPPGDPFPLSGPAARLAVAVASPGERPATTHLSVADRWGNVVSYTDHRADRRQRHRRPRPRVPAQQRADRLFNPVPLFAGVPDPNLPAPGKRPRSSMSPTIVFRDGRPVLAVGLLGGATIITTVLQILVEHLDRGASLPEAIAAPRVSQRNSDPGDAEPAFLASLEADGLEELGEVFQPAPGDGAAAFKIGAAAGIALGRHGSRRPPSRSAAAAAPWSSTRVPSVPRRTRMTDRISRRSFLKASGTAGAAGAVANAGPAMAGTDHDVPPFAFEEATIAELQAAMESGGSARGGSPRPTCGGSSRSTCRGSSSTR